MKRPEKKFKAGACTASIFMNEVDTEVGKIELKNVCLQKTYKDKDGNFQANSTFKINDIPKAILALEKAYEYMVLEGGNGDRKEKKEDGAEGL